MTWTQLLKTRLERIPIGFMGDGRDTANAALFLASDEARFITGTEIVVDGGMIARCDWAAQASPHWGPLAHRIRPGFRNHDAVLKRSMQVRSTSSPGRFHQFSAEKISTSM